MTLYDARICRICGCLDWYIDQYSTITIYGRVFNAANSDGSYDDDFERNDEDDSNDDDWEDSGDPKCRDCDDTNLMDIDDLTPVQFGVIFNLEPMLRVSAIELMRAGKEVDPETGEERHAPEKDKRKVGGYKIRQE